MFQINFTQSISFGHHDIPRYREIEAGLSPSPTVPILSPSALFGDNEGGIELDNDELNLSALVDAVMLTSPPPNTHLSDCSEKAARETGSDDSDDELNLTALVDAIGNASPPPCDHLSQPLLMEDDSALDELISLLYEESDMDMDSCVNSDINCGIENLSNDNFTDSESRESESIVQSDDESPPSGKESEQFITIRMEDWM